ncbi:hypothetical protein DLM85_16620 [Hymenobacter edaphi]|uniref:Uncharacterized protein n=1 Tax=Hymenobacter edaphi TaxID=2211146 RepID=A0A328BF95_9BACT|nr:hypothetical protein DLM85_16620 [Hymenobacter edaphi]
MLLTLSGSAQKILVRGLARDTTRGRNPVTVVVNDTVNKFARAARRQLDAPGLGEAQREALLRQFRALAADTAYVVRTDKQGRFRIRARKTDSLYFSSYHSLPARYPVAELRRRRAVDIHLQPQPCEPYVTCQDTAGAEYAFIGRKISLERTEHPYYCPEAGRPFLSMDGRYAARYQLLAQLAGRFPRDTMAFTAYDHYGSPAFGRHEQVLLFVQDYCGRLIHQKYQYYPVYRTADGRWAAPYQWLDHHDPELAPPIQPRPMAFAAPVVIDVAGAAPEYVLQHYPAPYYRVENGRATAVYGNYVDELLENRRRLRGPRRAKNARLEAQSQQLLQRLNTPKN